MDRIRGRIVGIFAKNEVGNITPSCFQPHTHLVYEDAKAGKMVTGHVESIGLLEGAILRLPKTN
jgi:hypothetical protein